GSSGGADRASEAGLPLSLCVEVFKPGKTKRNPACNADLCHIAKDSADTSDRRCGCSMADVVEKPTASLIITAWLRCQPHRNPPRLSTSLSLDWKSTCSF